MSSSLHMVGRLPNYDIFANHPEVYRLRLTSISMNQLNQSGFQPFDFFATNEAVQHMRKFGNEIDQNRLSRYQEKSLIELMMSSIYSSLVPSYLKHLKNVQS